MHRIELHLIIIIRIQFTDYEKDITCHVSWCHASMLFSVIPQISSQICFLLLPCSGYFHFNVMLSGFDSLVYYCNIKVCIGFYDYKDLFKGS